MTRAFNWTPLLLPGEALLWQGQPREGVGWRCMLRVPGLSDAVGLVAGVVLLCPLVLVVLAWPWPVMLAVIAVLLAVGIGTRVAWIGWRLGAQRYAITDRRSLLRQGVGQVSSLPHEALQPRHSHSICGVTIHLGQQQPDDLDLQTWATWSFDGIAEMLGDGNEVMFRTLDPDDAPVRLLTKLALGRDPSEAMREAGGVRDDD